MKKLTILLSLFVILSTPRILAQVNTQDSLALVALYNSTNGDNWVCGCNNDWLYEPVSNWSGVTVDSGRVTRIDLSFGILSCYTGCGLTGTIPPEIGQLSKLIDLDLSNSPDLTGPLPTEMGNLSALKRLYITNCSLSGSFPVGICLIPNLEDLTLYNNQISGSIPFEIGNLSNLKYLRLSNNHFSGTIPNQIGNLTKLSYLTLDHNQLSGIIPSEIGNCIHLESLAFNKNFLTGNLPSTIGNISPTTLILLYADSNLLEGPIPNEFLNLSSVRWLRFHNNNFTSVPNFTSLSHLEILQLENNKLTFEDIEPNITLNTIQLFSYSPQDSVNNAIDTSINIHSTVSLKASLGGQNNIYQWYHSGNVIPSAIDSIFTIANFTIADTGTYICKITNSVVANLTLWRRPVNLHLGPDGVSKIQKNIEPAISNINKLISIDFMNELSEAFTINIFSAEGKLIYSSFAKQGVRKIEINMEYYSVGIYTIKIYNKKKSISKMIYNQ